MAGFGLSSNYLPPGAGIMEAATKILAQLNVGYCAETVYLIAPCAIVARVIRNGNCPVAIEFGYPQGPCQSAEEAVALVPSWNRRMGITYYP